MKNQQMRNLITIIALIAFIFLNSCKKEGCKDPQAVNYNEKAKTEDGSCEYSENQIAVQKLEGQWKIIESKQDGKDQDPSDYKYITYQYDNCGNKESDCLGVYAYTSPGFNSSKPFNYSVSGFGTKLTLDFGTAINYTYDIVFINNNKIKQTFKGKDFTTEMVLEKL